MTFDNPLYFKWINAITKEQMHNLLQDYYEGALKKDPFVRTDDYKELTNKHKREWLNEKLNNHQQRLNKWYNRTTNTKTPEWLIDELWKYRKIVMKKSGQTAINVNDKKAFYLFIKDIFDGPIQVRIGKYP